LILYIYGHFKTKLGKDIFTEHGKWLDTDRQPLIPGNFHTEPIQPVNAMNDEHANDSFDEVDFKERDFSKLGRIIFVMRYHKKREELMIRLVQIEGLPVSHELYNANSAYVDVQLKYTGNFRTNENEVQRPPRLDICLQQVYYFIISEKQMLSHSVEFQINTFDDQYRRYVSGLVEVNLNEEMGSDIMSGAEVVFVKEIMEPFLVTEERTEHQDDFVTACSEQGDTEYDEELIRAQQQYESRPSSPASNMSWEPESRDLLTLSTNSLLNIQPYNSEQDFPLSSPLNDFKRSHSIGYLPTYEWTVKDIPLDEEVEVMSDNERHTTALSVLPDMSPLSPIENFPMERYNVQPTPESFYHIVPMTPLYNTKDSNSKKSDTHRRIMFKKKPKTKRLARSVTVNKRSTPKHMLQSRDFPCLERSSSWPSLHPPTPAESSTEVTPEHHGVFFD